ncbi:ribosome maturation factor RimP [Ruania rhizosphaerae]|uniref:ribosome maturation factor RimP n=1 Tax=Ruania rhizosphaerae TaxID=1840413 RepID=UPI00135C81D6|nr:ribosome maturation factor RimP [Ruania rhizosphaerae]
MSPSPGPHVLGEQLHEVLAPVVSGAGLYLEGVSVSGAARRRVVRVTVDLPDGPGGVTSDSLADVSRAVSQRLDEVEDLLAGSYLLEVTTPGVTRPLTEPRHFRRAEGRLVTVATGDREVSGRVLGTDGHELTLATASGTVSLPLSDVVRGRIDVELNRAGDGQD